MADRYPLVYNPSANQLQELQSGDSLDVGNSSIKGATGYATTTGTSSQFLKADGSVDSNTYLTSSGTVALAQNLTGSPNITISNVTGANGTFSGSITAVNGTFTGDVSIAGTITYDDVTHVDSQGIGTFRQGIDILAGGATIAGNSSITGILTATSFVKTGGTSSQFLKADGSSDGTAYISSIGISSAGTSIGNATTLNFIGVGNTFAVNGNTIDVSIQGSAGGSSSGGGALDITSCLFI